MKKALFLSIPAALVLMVSSCKKDKTEDPAPTTTTTGSTYTVPTTYAFTNMTYSGQTTRIGMMSELGTYMKTSNTQGTVLSATQLKNMFSNTGSPFTDTSFNSSGKDLKSKCFSLDQTFFEELMDSLALISTSTVNGSNGVAGVVVSTSQPTKKYLLNYRGYEFTQMIEKGLMGAVLYYQAMESYLCTAGVGAGVDNSTVVTGEGTTMEHHWDEGFGYFGVPVDFPTTVTGLKYWGSYSNQVNAAMGGNSTMMDAFLKGRAAISNNDMTTKDAQMAILRTNWEKLVAAAAIHEMNAAKTNIADDALRGHYLSEAYGFVLALKYKSDKLITQTQIDLITGTYLGPNLYNITVADVDNAINLISSTYGLDGIKAIL
jgi:hypothetical protein